MLLEDTTFEGSTVQEALRRFTTSQTQYIRKVQSAESTNLTEATKESYRRDAFKELMDAYDILGMELRAAARRDSVHD